MTHTLFKDKKSELVVGVGSALVDILLQETEEFLLQTKGAKGGMTLVGAEIINTILSQSNQKASIVPGGSSCNTIIGLGALGAQTRFIGKRGNDALGKQLETALIDFNVEPQLTVSQNSTGRVLSVITPDAQRSMFTFLGASAETVAEEITVEKFKDAALVHLEGYLLFNKNLFIKILEIAKSVGAVISLDLASFTVVEASKQILDDLIKNYVDIILANEDEARVFTGCSDEGEAARILARDAAIAVVKAGKRGSYIACENDVCAIGIQGTGEAVDTTGAGDLWASGFLYGLIKNMPLKKCGELGAACGYHVCQVIGAHIPTIRWEEIRSVR